MVKPRELAICKRRGHAGVSLDGGWRQCKWCGMWLRTVTTIEEREDAPPAKERSVFEAIENRVKTVEANK